MRRNAGIDRSPSVHGPDSFDTAPPQPAPAQPSPPASQASPSGPPAGWRQQTARQQKQLREANAVEASECNARFGGYCLKMRSLLDGHRTLLAKAKADVKASDAADARARQDPDARATLTKLADTLLDRATATFRKAADAVDARTADGKTMSEVVGADIQKIEGAPNRNSLYTLAPHLKDHVEQAKVGLVTLETSTIVAMADLVECEARRAGRTLGRLVTEQDELLAQSGIVDQYPAARAGLLRGLGDFEAQAATLADCAARNAELVARCDALLAKPDLGASASIKDIKHLRQTLLCNGSLNTIHGTNVTNCRIRTLAALTLYDNASQPGFQRLRAWSSTVLEAGKAFRAAAAVNICVLHEEQADGKRRAPLPPQEMAARLKAAIEGPEQFGKVARLFLKRVQEYADMRGSGADQRLAALLAAMPEQLAECMRVRTYASQKSAEQLESLEAAPFTAAPYQPPAGVRALQQTRDGMVMGCVTPAGGLDGLDEHGNVIASYFKDQDSGTWVRDYGDEAEPAAPAAAPLDKARNIAARAGRIGREAQAALAACDDHDERVDLLQRAFSRTARELTAVAGVLADLAPDSAEAGTVKGMLAGLREDKAGLDRQLQQAQQAQNFHAHKSREPNEASFLHLLKSEQVASVVKNFARRPSQKEAGDWLDRYTITFKSGPRGERYDPWVAHAHYTETDAAGPVTSHLKRDREKDWGKDRRPYHSPALAPGTLDRIIALAQAPRPKELRDASSRFPIRHTPVRQQSADTRSAPGETPEAADAPPHQPALRRSASPALGSDAQGRLAVVSNRQAGPGRASSAPDVRAVYEANRLYHGTGDASKRSIREQGFRSERKVDGGSAAATTGWAPEDRQAPSYHYFTTERRRADRYALAAESGSPSIVRTLGVRHDFPMERVMGVDRTASDIPPEYVLGSRNSAPGRDGAVFQQALARADIHVALDEAGRLLRSVQSDSEDDFSSSDSD